MTQDRESQQFGLGSSSTTEPQSQQRMSEQASEISSNVQDKANEYGEKVQDRANEYGEKVQDRANEYGQKAQHQADAGIDKAASGLQKAADQMRHRVDQQGGMQAEVGNKVAGGLEKSANYLQEHEASEIWDDVEQFVKDHPIQTAAGAAIAGFLIARIMR